MKRILLITFSLSTFLGFSQYRKNDGNRIGISGGITNTAVYTSNFNTKPESGWIAGLSVRGNFYNDNWSMIYGMQFTDSNFSVETTNTLLQKEDVKYKLSGVQIRLLGSYHLINDNLCFDFGPVLQVNGKLKVDDNDKNNIINKTALAANDIVDITKVNANFFVGLSGGGKVIRANLFYQYGLTNMFNNLNKYSDLKLKNNNNDFKGHLGMISGQLTFNL
ncbi:PorT family protein [Flavobacterium sp. H122]|uniref:PorT family protein n=1 Tax=Flavobacterium sp. H122 TaxID=2529860 RepID=UPI0010A9CBC6|nr:PorT family protein [Flavobacterium sp. H122]